MKVATSTVLYPTNSGIAGLNRIQGRDDYLKFCCLLLLYDCATSRKVTGSIPDGVIEFFFIDIILPAALWPWVDSASNRNKYQECFLGVKAAGA